MASISELAEKIFTVVSKVDDIRSDIADVKVHLFELRDRVSALENSHELIAEKAKNASLHATNQAIGTLTEKIVRLEMQLENYSSSNANKIENHSVGNHKNRN